MPLIKAQQSAPLFKDAIVLNMNDVAEQAQQIKTSARKTAEQMIADAKAKAQKVTDDHASQGMERGYAEGYEKGQADGHEQGLIQGKKSGHDQAVKQARELFEPLVESWKQAAIAWDEYHNQLDMDARDSVIELALRLTEKIIHRQLQVDPYVVVDQVSSALKSITGATRLSIHICPQDRAVMDQVMPQLLETFCHFKQMRVVEDENIGLGGCVLVHEFGKLNASLETQLRRAVELLLPGDLEADTLQAEAGLQLVPDEQVEDVAAQGVSEDALAPQEAAQSPELQSTLAEENADNVIQVDEVEFTPDPNIKPTIENQ
ncbi:MAG: hypothetical protein JKX85_04160 [Phycisphaeraceae bacterium]|nr:hypothetical protein [Phycisphaeraceae bacterium]